MGVAGQLVEAGYQRLFLAGDGSSAAGVWSGGENRDALQEIVRADPDDLARVLAAEVLYGFDDGFPSAGDQEVLGEVYARALGLTGVGDRPILLTGNLWSMLWAEPSPASQGPLGTHLLQTGQAAVPHLVPLLDDDAPIFYDGSEEATIGAGLRYRVKDAAAYYLGRLTETDVPYREDHADRDAEAERLKEQLSG